MTQSDWKAFWIGSVAYWGVWVAWFVFGILFWGKVPVIALVALGLLVLSLPCAWFHDREMLMRLKDRRDFLSVENPALALGPYIVKSVIRSACLQAILLIGMVALVRK